MLAGELSKSDTYIKNVGVFFLRVPVLSQDLVKYVQFTGG